MNLKFAKALAHKNYLLGEICSNFCCGRPTRFFGAAPSFRNQISSAMLANENGKYIIKLSLDTRFCNLKLFSTLKVLDTKGKFRNLELTEDQVQEFLPCLNRPMYLIIGNVMDDSDASQIKFRAFLFDIITSNSTNGISVRQRLYFSDNNIYPVINSCELNHNPYFAKCEVRMARALLAAA